MTKKLSLTLAGKEFYRVIDCEVGELSSSLDEMVEKIIYCRSIINSLFKRENNLREFRTKANVYKGKREDFLVLLKLNEDIVNDIDGSTFSEELVVKELLSIGLNEDFIQSLFNLHDHKLLQVSVGVTIE